MVADISQASTLPVGPTRFAARIVWLPAPQAKSRTRMPVWIPAISMSVSVAVDRPAENLCSHLAQPGAAFSQVSRSWDFDALSGASEACFPDFIAASEGVSTLRMNSLLSKESRAWARKQNVRFYFRKQTCAVHLRMYAGANLRYRNRTSIVMQPAAGSGCSSLPGRQPTRSGDEDCCAIAMSALP